MLQALQEQNTETKTIRVIIVDDYTLSRLGLRAMLQADPQINIMGEAPDGETAVSLVKQLQPDVVLMDLGLPGITGIEATRLIQEFDNTIKVIVLTSHEEEDTVIEALGAGAHAYCIKSNLTKNLINTIKTVYSGGTWLDSCAASLALKIIRKSILTQSPDVLKKSNGSVGVEISAHDFNVLKLLVHGKPYFEDSGSPE